MRENRSAAVALILRHEGGYVDHPSDPGGCTNYGITIHTYRRYVDTQGTCADLRRMPRATAEQIYVDTYWTQVNGDRLPPGVDLSVVDFGVNAGPSRAAKMLQRAVGVTSDGLVGPITLRAARSIDGAVLIRAYSEARLAYYRSLKTWSTFGRGWTRRTHETRDEALKLHALNQVQDDVDDEPEPDGPGGGNIDDVFTPIPGPVKTGGRWRVRHEGGRVFSTFELTDGLILEPMD